MIWQDYVFTAAAGFFVLSLVPTMRDRAAAVPRLTSVPTAVFILALAATQATMGLVLAPVLEVCSAGCWLFIAARRAPSEFDLFKKRVLDR